VKLVLVQPELSYDASADNLGIVRRDLEPHAGELGAADIVLLPEHFDLRPDRAAYEAGIATLARDLGCHVVGGSHHEDREGGRVNSGVVAAPDGSLVGRYEKLRPYADERSRVRGGAGFGELTIGGCHVLVLICADFWFSDVFYGARALPDLVLVPALSVTRKPTPDYSRALWRHLAVARAYEFGAYVGVSDWAHAPGTGFLSASGVAGLADPTQVEPTALYRPVAGASRAFSLDFEALARFRGDRMSRGFFWKRPDG
jgi:predicted amidohydrolase